MATKREDPVEVYDLPLRNPDEPELFLPEATKAEIKEKIKEEEEAIEILQEAEEYDIGKDQDPTTSVVGLHTNPQSTGTESMSETRIDNFLRNKKNKLIKDLARLRAKYVTPIDENIKAMETKQRSLTYASLTNAGARSARSYLEGLKKSRRRKPAGRKAGETTSET